ncbi:MAG: Crp/Fnr family transcriptional regulator [Limnochordia bacterium]
MTMVESCAMAVPVFRDLPAESLQQLDETMQHRRWSRGETVMAHGTFIEHLVIVADGELKLVRTTSSGREQVIRVLGPGEFFGEMALFTQIELEGDLIAAADTGVCMVPRAGVQKLLRVHPELSLALVEALAQRLYEAEQLIAELGLRDVGQRLAAALLRYAEAAETNTVSLPISWAELAVRLGTTPETLSRRLRTMTEKGIIEQKAQRLFVVVDHEALSDLARI